MTDRPIIFSAPMVRALLDGRKSQTRRLLKLAGRRPDYIGPKGCTGDPACWGWDNGDGGYILADRDPSDKFAASWHDFAASYAVGDRLWCREAFSYDRLDVDRCGILPPWYWADGNPESGDWSRPKPSIHMPRWASRLTLIVTDVRVQRLQDISEADAVADGMQPYKFPGPWWQGYRDDGDGDLVQQQYVGETPPEWMIEPRRMKDMTHLDRSAVHLFTTLWNDLHGPEAWAANPWVAALTFEPHRQNIDQINQGDMK